VIRALPALAATLCCTAAAAQGEEGVTVDSRPPRSVGYFVGDRLDYAGTIQVPRGYAVDEASRPRPRDLDYWLEMDRVSIEPSGQGQGTAFTVQLRYQTFYVPLEPHELRIPPVTIGFIRKADGARLEATLPGFTFVSAPLRPILERGSPATMRPDAPLLVLDTRPAQWRTGAAFVVSLALLGVLAAYRGWLPTGARRPRPLAEAARSLARSDPHASPQAYRAGLLALHRALDACFARRLLADDLDLFLALQPRFAEASSDLRRFFAASRSLHFGDDVAEAMRQLPADDLARLARRLASIERAP
jgi:mxaA protein